MTRKIMVKDVAIGGDAPISIQSMCNTDTRDIKATTEQILRLSEAGCEIVRVAVVDKEAAEAISKIKKNIDIPIVADIHFDYRLALLSIENGADKLRINPGNIGNEDRLLKVVNAAKERNIPIRVGVNGGSLEKDLLIKYGDITPEALCESAENTVQKMYDIGFEDIVLSMKSSDILLNYKAHMLIKDKLDVPLHIGITEAGPMKSGSIKSAIGIGSLLLNGIGNTIRVSLTGDPVQEIYAAKEILKSIGLRDDFINLISCPTCGRCQIDLKKITDEVEKMIEEIEPVLKKNKVGKINLAVMGCSVNGPGEAKHADIGIAGGKENGILISKGDIIDKVPENQLIKALYKEIRKRYLGEIDD